MTCETDEMECVKWLNKVGETSNGAYSKPIDLMHIEMNNHWFDI